MSVSTAIALLFLAGTWMCVRKGSDALRHSSQIRNRGRAAFQGRADERSFDASLWFLGASLLVVGAAVAFSRNNGHPQTVELLFYLGGIGSFFSLLGAINALNRGRKPGD